MAVKNDLFLFEVVIEKINVFLENRLLVIKSDFANIFSFDLKDPKAMHIKIPDPPPPPPEPPGKKGKKKKPPKPKKGKKGKGVIPPPPPEPEILVGKSVLFTSSPEVLLRTMKECPIVISLWSKEENLQYIGCNRMTWDEVFLKYLRSVYNCENVRPPTVKDEYNIFEEHGTGKLMAKMTMRVKLTYLTDRVVTSFRTLTEDPVVKKVLYTGMNSKTTSYMCTLKTTDEDFEKIFVKKPNKYIKDGPKLNVIADYKNAPGAVLPLNAEPNYCCKSNADKPPDNKYTRPETYPDIDYICDYVRKIIRSCNDNMRMLTPRPTIKPRIKATDIDKLCYCKQTYWPKGDLAERFRKETQGGPCPICIKKIDGQDRPGTAAGPKRVLDIANIRGPCGRPDCRIARDIRAYLEKIVEEDNKEIKLEDIVGPCGSKECSLVDKIKDFLQHTGKFKHGAYVPGLSTQCACLDRMQNALIRKGSCSSICSHDCESDSDNCGGKTCPYSDQALPRDKKKPDEAQSQDKPSKDKPSNDKKVYYVYYFTVEYGDKSPDKTATPSKPSSPSQSTATTPSQPETVSSRKSGNKFKYCAPSCPTSLSYSDVCSKSVCGVAEKLKSERKYSASCTNVKCPTREAEKQVPRTPSPADSDIELKFNEIRNPCCVKSCDVAEKVKDLITEGLDKKAKQISMFDDKKDPCFCDCVCEFPMSGQTTYCTICGGYEFLGDAVKQQPGYLQPFPCPVFHKMTEKKKIDPDRSIGVGDGESIAAKSGKQGGAKQLKSVASTTVEQSIQHKQVQKKEKKPKKAARHEPVQAASASSGKYHNYCYEHIEAVPKHMGWLWNAEDIPGMKFRPKWKPGAANKILVRRYRAVREGVDTILKKKRALLNKKKKIEMKPTLVVTKKDGEYTVQMEVFKKYSKERLRYQYPYDEKPPLIYTIGKTEETKARVQKQRERRERRENRRKCRLLQSTFRDKCQEICVKAYNQSIGLLPTNNPNFPECPCDSKELKQPSPIIDSCSCSENASISSSDTDGDDWIIEFTPPMARWDVKAKNIPVTTCNECQYNYLDYKVKCLDKQGNQVPRFFKGPDGTEQCSDLGGFYGMDGTWLEINKDGYIGADERWVPQNFTGPDGQYYLSEEGVFTDTTGHTWKIGVDGYVDKDLKWQFYPGKKRYSKSAADLGPTSDHKEGNGNKKKTHKCENETKTKTECKTATDNKPEKKDASKLQTTAKTKSPVVVNFITNFERHQRKNPQKMTMLNQIEIEKLARYQEIMEGLQMYDDVATVRPPTKTNRAVETRQGVRTVVSKYSVYDSKGRVSSSKMSRIQYR